MSDLRSAEDVARDIIDFVEINISHDANETVEGVTRLIQQFRDDVAREWIERQEFIGKKLEEIKREAYLKGRNDGKEGK